MFPELLGALGLGVGSALGGSLLGDTFLQGNQDLGPNPTDSAMPYLNQISGVGNQYYSPYIGRGMQSEDYGRNQLNRGINQYTSSQGDAGNVFPDEYRQMARDPRAFMEALMSGYEPSKGFQSRKNNALSAYRNSAASGGFAGTQYDQERQGRMSDELLSEDIQQYLSNLMGIQGSGLQGEQNRLMGRERGLQSLANYEQPIGQRGFQAGTGLADFLGNALGAQAGAAFQGQRQQNANKMALNAQNMNARGAGMNFLGDSVAFAAKNPDALSKLFGFGG